MANATYGISILSKSLNKIACQKGNIIEICGNLVLSFIESFLKSVHKWVC